MKRRKFIQQSGLGLSAALLPFSCVSNRNPQVYKMGLQVYSIRDAMAKDPIETLKKATAMGYEDLETYGYDTEKGTYYGYKAKEFKTILDDLNLTASSGHYGFSDYLMRPLDDLNRFVDQCIIGADALDKSYITWPWLAPEYRTLETFKPLAKKLNIIGERVNKAGLGFAYHNHGFEFKDYNGETGYDIILQDTDPSLVKLQMDLYWVMHSSELTPKELVADQPGRYVMWHIKDMDKITRDYTELGNGSIDYHEIMPDPKASGLDFYYLEQGGNFAVNSMQSIADSADYFKKNLMKYL